MANLIRLKQIESGSSLEAAAEVGADFSQSVINIITSEVSAVLPEGVISSSVQVNLISASGYQELATDLEVSIVSSSISTSIGILSQTYATTASLNTISSSLDGRVTSLEEFSTSLDLTFATDAELAVSQSNINIDMGEW
jgi:hypothetical protein